MHNKSINYEVWVLVSLPFNNVYTFEMYTPINFNSFLEAISKWSLEILTSKIKCDNLKVDLVFPKRYHFKVDESLWEFLGFDLNLFVTHFASQPH